MTPLKIFLASSQELKDDRRAFELFLGRENKLWAKRGVLLELVIWEDFLDTVSRTRLQDEYNKAIRDCDIFVMLFSTKVGKYTAEEFATAFGQFQSTNKPRLLTYFKNIDVNLGSLKKEDLNSLWAFQEKLKQLGHFQTEYHNPEGLCLHFRGQLDKLADEGFINFEPPDRNTLPHLLTPPPFLPERFIGREAELHDIHDQLFSGASVLLLVNGDGGIGKTSLAARYFHAYQKEYTHLAWVLSESNITTALLGLAAALGVRFEDTLPLAERRERLLTAMAALPGPCLLVIDNANELDDLAAHYLHLQRCPNFHVLLTTRVTEFSAAATCKIAGLPEPEALQLFRAFYPGHNAQEDALFQKIRVAVGGNTLVLELLAKTLHARNRLKTHYALAQLLADLQSRGVLGLSQSATVATGYHSRGSLRHAQPEDIIRAMYDLSQLAPAETALLSALAVLPAERLPFAALEILLRAEKDLETNLLNLAQKGWLEFNPNPAALKCSPVVQEIVKKKNPRLFEDCESLIEALTDKLDYETNIGHPLNATYEEAAVFARYGASVIAAFAEAKRELYFLCDRIGNYYQTTGNLERALFFYEKRLALTQALSAAAPEDEAVKNGLAISYERVGSLHTSLGHLDQALRYFEDYARLKKELHEAFPNNVEFKNGLAISYSKLGATHTSLGHLDQALRYFEDYARLEKELHEAFPNNVEFKNGLAISYFNLGSTHNKLGTVESALSFFEKDLEVTKELYEAFPNNVEFKNNLALSYKNMGERYENAANSDTAREYFEQAAALWSQLVQSAPQFVQFQKNLAAVQKKLAEP